MNTILALIIFVIVYVFIAIEKIESTIVVILGAFAMLALRLLTFEEAVHSVDLNVLFLLVGMMVSVYTLSQTGFFEWVATSLAKKSGGNPVKIALFFLTATMVMSAFLDNVTTIILIAPVSILIMQLIELSPVPLLIMEAIASNIGGTATLIGDPPNIVVGSSAGLSFNDFMINAAPAILVVYAVFALTAYLLLRKTWKVSDAVKVRVTEASPELAIVSKSNLIKALSVLGLIILGFFTQSLTGIETGIIALTGAMLMLFVCKVEVDHSFLHVEWNVIFFFIGLFIIVAGLEVNGVIEWLGKSLLGMAGSNHFYLCVIILVGGALISTILNNIPFTMAMVPMIKQMIDTIATQQGLTDPAMIERQIAYPLWWSLVLGVCLGGNGTLIGSSVNVIAAKISGKNSYPISFMHFTKYGFPFMLQSLAISILYIWMRYFH